MHPASQPPGVTNSVQGFLGLSMARRRTACEETQARMRLRAASVEKDFWVCWTLDAPFNGLQPGGPRLLFKGGTSLSKGYGLIERFSEDIGITVFRADIDAPASVEELEALSRKQRERRLPCVGQQQRKDELTGTRDQVHFRRQLAVRERHGAKHHLANDLRVARRRAARRERGCCAREVRCSAAEAR